MNYSVDDVILRQPEPKDIDALYLQKNDPEIANLLGGFALGYSRAGIAEWIECHRSKRDEIVWVIALADADRCIGHVGLYNIDYRVRSAEFAVVIGDKASMGRGIGKAVSRHVLQYGFGMLNLNRIHLSFLAYNLRARHLYESLGFREEGILRQAQYKNGAFIDVVLMSLLRHEHDSTV